MKPVQGWSWVVLLAALTPTAGPSGARYDPPTTHVTISKRAVALAVREGYQELETYWASIKAGTIDEDSGEPIMRFANHFFDPTTGLGMPKNSYTILYEGSLPSFGDSTRYMSAYEWGLDGMPDDRDWHGAIDAYDCTDMSRNKAYEALGHVVHLLQDMAQPDHATCRPHPGGYVHEFLAGEPDKDSGYWRLIADYLAPESRIGYEALWAYMNTEWPEGQSVRKPRDLNDAFRTLAYEAKQAEQALGLPDSARGESALGLRSYVSARADPGGAGREAVGEVLTVVFDALAVLWRMEQYDDFEDDLWAHFELNAPIVPTIPWPANAQTQPYIELGRKLLPLAEEHSAGLFEHFHDIVNQPPFVESVRIKQEEQQNYFARWEDTTDAQLLSGRVLRRTMRKSPGAPLKFGEPAVVSITFAPFQLIEGKQHRERVTNVQVWYEPSGATFDGPDPPVAWAVKGAGFLEQTDNLPTPVWVGSFTPLGEGRLRIRAEDLDAHLAGREPLGNLLDSLPADPARALSTQGYPWTGYQPGDDLNHGIGGIDDCAIGRWSKEQQETLSRSGTWHGTASGYTEWNRFGEGWVFDSKSTVELSFRSLAVVLPWQRDDIKGTNFFLTFGGARGRYVSDGAGFGGDPPRHEEGEVRVCGLLVLNPPEGTPHHQYFFRIDPLPPEGAGPTYTSPDESVTVFEQKACEDGLLSGTVIDDGESSHRRKTIWNLTFTPDPEPPPHERPTLDLGGWEPHGMNEFNTHVMTLLTPAYQSPEAVQPLTDAVMETANRYSALRYPAMQELQDRISDLHKEAGELWIPETPLRNDGKYEAKVAELESVVRDWWAIRKQADAIYADGADRLAGLVAAKHPTTAEALRKAARKLREQGSHKYGAGD